MNTKSRFTKIEVFSEDIAEFRTCVWNSYALSNQKDNPRRKELDEIMGRIYDSMFMNSTPVLLLDRDGRNMKEFKTE